MKWYELLKYISLVGEICSATILIVSFLLILYVCKSNKYLGKRVNDSPLLIYSRILGISGVLVVIFSFLVIILS